MGRAKISDVPTASDLKFGLESRTFLACDKSVAGCTISSKTVKRGPAVPASRWIRMGTLNQAGFVATGCGATEVAGGVGVGGFWGIGFPVMTGSACCPCPVNWYLAGFPKKSTLYSIKPSDVSCLTTQRVVHSEVSFIASLISESLMPSLLFPSAVIAAIKCGEEATAFRTRLCRRGSGGQTQSPLFMNRAVRG